MQRRAGEGSRRSAPALPLLLAATAFLLFAACSGDGAATASGEACAEPERTLRVGFYAYFAPVSAALGSAPGEPDFDTHTGYEADLLDALEAMERTGLAFERRAVADWPEIWLLAAGPDYDLVGGGITILDERRRDRSGAEAILFTSGHIAFRQSLLVRTEDQARLSTYAALTSADRVGVLAGTTGEARLLQLTGLADADGVLAAGLRIRTATGELRADGTARFYIRAAGAAPALQERRLIVPVLESQPQVVYLGAQDGERELLAALAAGDIDAVARGEIGNREAAHASGRRFAVAALDPAVEWGGFALAADERTLAGCIDSRINYLTDDRRIGYAQWRADPQVFMRRAQRWNRER